MLSIAFGKASLLRWLPTPVRCTGGRKLWILMKLTVFLILVATLHATAKAGAQKVTLNEKNVSLEKVFKKITKQSGYVFFYADDLLQKTKNVTVVVKNASIEQVLDLCLEHQWLDYSIVEKTIVIKEKQIEKTFNAPFLLPPPFVVKGNIVNENNQPVSGATVAVKGTSQATTTNEAGKFELKGIDGNATLLISYVGYKSQEISINGRPSLAVKMQPDIKEIDQVVVVGYGTQKKINLTGSVASINGAELEKRHVVNPAASLEGLLPGVRVVQSSGQPGAEGVGIEIRGMGTYSGAGSSPLVLINGVPGSLSDLDPNNIESVSVLKDAASASIYGARAANGVILVTTKDGSKNGGKFTVNYNVNYGTSTPTKLPDLVTNSVDYMNLFNQAKTNSGITGADQLYPQSVIDLYKNPADPVKYPNADWTSLMFHSAPATMHNLSVSGGQKTTYNASIGYSDQVGVMQAFNYQKYNAQFNLASTISTRLKMGFNIGFKNGNQSQPRNGAQDAFYQTLAHAPTALPF